MSYSVKEVTAITIYNTASKTPALFGFPVLTEHLVPLIELFQPSIFSHDKDRLLLPKVSSSSGGEIQKQYQNSSTEFCKTWLKCFFCKIRDAKKSKNMHGIR